jgi:hypothetical protein
MYPSGLEGNLLYNRGSYKVDLKKRERIAKKAQREHNRLVKKVSRPEKRRLRKERKDLDRLLKSHVDKQHVDVQKRMKANQRYTERNYSSRKTLKQKLLYIFKQNKCKNGI